MTTLAAAKYGDNGKVLSIETCREEEVMRGRINPYVGRFAYSTLMRAGSSAASSSSRFRFRIIVFARYLKQKNLPAGSRIK